MNGREVKESRGGNVDGKCCEEGSVFILEECPNRCLVKLEATPIVRQFAVLDPYVNRAVRQTRTVKTRFNSFGSMKVLVWVWHHLIGLAGEVVSSFLFRFFDLRIVLGAEETM